MSVVRNSPAGSLPRGKRFSRYEVVSLLGAGGMGEVYRARDTVLSRDVALKILTSEAGRDSARFRRFQMEAQASAALSHSNIVSVYDVGEEGGIPYIVSELVEGATLATALARGPFPTRRLLDLAVGMADGLAAAHAAGIVHRDLKPANVLMTASGVPKIADFGLAKHFRPSSDSEGSHLSTLPDERTTEGTILGTVGYMSPEQAKGEPADFRSDQFSFGAILYEMATGKRAFQRSSSVQTLAAIVQEEPEPIAAQNSGVPAPIRWTVERCLAKDPKGRYASTEDLARDLSSLRDHISEVGSGESAGPALKRSRLRRRAFVASTAAALFAAIAAVLLRRTDAFSSTRMVLLLRGTERLRSARPLRDPAASGFGRDARGVPGAGCAAGIQRGDDASTARSGGAPGSMFGIGTRLESEAPCQPRRHARRCRSREAESLFGYRASDT